MNRTFLAATALVAALSAAAPASATITYTLTNVTLATPSGTAAGTLMGSFTTNDARTSVLGYNIQASASGSFAGFLYTPLTSTVTAAVLPSQYLQISSPGSVNELRLYFASSLAATGATAISSTFSYEFETTGGSRAPTGGVVASTAVPEPASWAMMIGGFGLVGGTLRRRTRQTVRVTYA